MDLLFTFLGNCVTEERRRKKKKKKKKKALFCSPAGFATAASEGWVGQTKLLMQKEKERTEVSLTLSAMGKTLLHILVTEM